VQEFLPAPEFLVEGLHPITQAVVDGASRIAGELDAKLFVVASRSGLTVIARSKRRGAVPTIGLSDNPASLRQMALYWGVTPLASATEEDVYAKLNLAWVAPEAREGERSPATDLYALGATVVAWATGAPPAPGEPPALPSWLPEPLSALTKALLADRIAERPRDAEAALRALSGGSFGSAMGPRALPTRPALVGMDVAIERLLTTLDARGWALVVGPSGSGRSRVIEEVARAVQRREGRAGRAAPTYLRTDRWPDSPTAPTFVHLEGAIDREVAVGRARRILSDGRIAGLTHRVVLEMSDADGPEPGEVVRVPPLETDEARALLASLLGEAPGALALRAAMDASGGLAGACQRAAAHCWMICAPFGPRRSPLSGACAGGRAHTAVWRLVSGRHCAVPRGIRHVA
jgi:hypothetical protein